MPLPEPKPKPTCLKSFNYYYRVTGEEAERLMNEYGNDGEFLARYSESQSSNFSLTTKRDGRPMHIKIQKTDDDLLSVYGTTEGESFSTMVELLEYYIEYPDRLIQKNGNVVCINKPIYIPFELEKAAYEQRVTQVQRWFHGNMTASEAISILEKEKTGSFLVRNSQHLPGAFVISAKSESSVVHLTAAQNPQTGTYTIDGDTAEYKEISLLLAAYNNNPIVEKAQASRVVYLEHPVTGTYVPADVIADRTEILKVPIEQGNLQRTGMTEEYEKLQAEQGPAEQMFTKREGRREVNIGKNRYKNIVPFDHSRVVLKATGMNYINASYVRFLHPDPPLTLRECRNYIATQGCLEATINDFWQMVWQENSRVIVMPTRENERREKCCRYWPEFKNTLTFGQYEVTTLAENPVMKEIPEDLLAVVEHYEDKEVSYIERRFLIKKAGEEPRKIYHMQFVSWPDHGCPFHPHEVITFLEAVDEVHLLGARDDPQQGPVIVHCSAGIGRTGTFMILDVLLTQIKTRGRDCPIDVWRTARHARNYRGGLVQTDQQYGFLYSALSYYIQKHNKNTVVRIIERGGKTASSTLPLAPMPPPPPIRMPDPAMAYIGPSVPSAALSPRSVPQPSRSNGSQLTVLPGTRGLLRSSQKSPNAAPPVLPKKK
ncbi:unnamed protein product [Caenorhabditis auriculariae]|uniref:protein-tyrosine-phosphatase n=1 Tax=Caenorhabditis auriculariae TaxID=2777116 RepID=A0A8S1HJT5_9PELO|nr:unnamed protein product [Caenorhabditis auriculariae]